MNYKLSVSIREKIKKANRILVNCHRNPDPDSVGSALGLYHALKKLGKEVLVICPTPVSRNLMFLPGTNDIQTINFKTFDFEKYDLFVVLDSSSARMITGEASIPLPEILTIVIDHHKTNEKFGAINLIDTHISSCGELLYKIFEDWGLAIDTPVATCILTGILADTGIFQYPGVGVETLKVAQTLMEKGGDKDRIIHEVFRSLDINLLRFWGEVLSKMKIDEEGKFVWAAIPYEKFKEFGSPAEARQLAASDFASVVAGTNFGIVMAEQEKKKLSISFRSRTGFDTTKIAVLLKGGGHIYASGGRVEGLPFEKAVEKVLETARKVVNENKN